MKTDKQHDSIPCKQNPTSHVLVKRRCHVREACFVCSVFSDQYCDLTVCKSHHLFLRRLHNKVNRLSVSLQRRLDEAWSVKAAG